MLSLLQQSRSGRGRTKRKHKKKTPVKEYTYRQVKELQQEQQKRRRRKSSPLDQFGQQEEASWWAFWLATTRRLKRQELLTVHKYETDAIRVTLPFDPQNKKSARGLLIPPRPVLVVGMPKSGTSSIASFFRCAAKFKKSQHRIMQGFTRLGWHFTPYRTVSHYQCLTGRSCGRCMADQQQEGGFFFPRRFRQTQGMLQACGDYHVWTQLDTSQGGECVFPQMDYLPQITKEQPHATFLLNQRNSSSWVRSIDGWFEKRAELDSCALRGDLRNFPVMDLENGAEERDWDAIAKPSDEDYEQWYQRHAEFIRWYVERNPTHTLIEVNIESENVGADLANLFWGGGSRFSRLVDGKRQEGRKRQGWGSAAEEQAQECWGQQNSANHYAKLRSGWVSNAKNPGNKSHEVKGNQMTRPFSDQSDDFDDDEVLALQELRRVEWQMMYDEHDAGSDDSDANAKLFATHDHHDEAVEMNDDRDAVSANNDTDSELVTSLNLTSRGQNETWNATTAHVFVQAEEKEDEEESSTIFEDGNYRLQDEEWEPGLEGPVILVGLPETGVSYVESFFRCSARQSNNGEWKKWRLSPPTSHRKRTCGSEGHQACGTCFEQALRSGQHMFRKCGSYNVWSRTEDIPRPKSHKQKCILPQADMMEDITRVAPEAVLILTKWQSPQLWLELLQRKYVRKRLQGCDFLRNWPTETSSPSQNSTDEDFLQWHENHVQFLRRYVERHATHSLLEIAVDDPKDHVMLHRLLRCQGEVPIIPTVEEANNSSALGQQEQGMEETDLTAMSNG